MSEAAVTVTIKYSGDYDGTWAVFKGTIHNVRCDLIDFFGLNFQPDGEETLSEISIAATEAAQNLWGFSKPLGAKVVKGSKSGGKGNAKPEPQEEDHSDLIAALEGATSVEDLKALWAKNKAAFDNKDVKAAYSKRGKELRKLKKGDDDG